MSISSPDQTTGSLLLLSGGIDSATLLAQEAPHRPVTPMIVNYGQRGARREIEAANRLCRQFEVRALHLDLADTGDRFREGLAQRAHMPLPHRNLVILSLAVSYAATRGISRITLALNCDDLASYPSASPDFLERFYSMIGSLEPGLEIATPLRDLDKAAVIRLGHRLGVDLANTWSCLLGHPQHCGACPQCRNRRAAFRAAGLSDLTRYRHAPPAGT